MTTTHDKDVIRALMEEGAKLVTQRDDLLEALRDCDAAMSAIDTSYGTSDFLPGDKARNFFAAIQQARVAIKSATESAKAMEGMK